MFALCFTSVAAAELRRVQIKKTTRKQTNPALKAVRVGLASLAIVLAAAGTTLAGGHHGGGGGGGGGNSFRSSGSQRMSQPIQNFSQKNIGTFKSGNSNVLSRAISGNNNFNVPKNFTSKGPIQLNGQTVKIDRGHGSLSNTLNKKLGGLNNVVNKNSGVFNLPGNKNIGNILHHGNGNGNGISLGNNNHCNKNGKCNNWNWCWNHHCKPSCYKPCQSWSCWNYPTWCNLHRYRCGYYVNVPVVVVQGIDLQLLAVRLVDSGDATQNLGPRFRVWMRNNTPTPMLQPFNVLAMAASSVVPTQDLPQAGVRIEAMQPGQILPVDIRLPVQANDANLGMIHVLVDSHREVSEVFEDNNGIVLPRSEVMSVDPALLASDVQQAVPGSEINVAGEGLGAAAGQVIVKLAGLEMPAEVLGWSELGIQIRLPSVPMVNPVDAQIIAIRADGKTIQPLPLKVVPGQVQASVQPTEVQPAAAVGTTDQPTAVQAMFGG